MPDVQPRWKSEPKKARKWRKPLRPVSVKRQAENEERRANLLARFGTHPVCYACVPFSLIGVTREQTGCSGRAEDAHELLPRGRGGSITDVSNIRPVSRACHDFAHAWPEAATEAGLLIPSVTGPRSVP